MASKCDVDLLRASDSASPPPPPPPSSSESSSSSASAANAVNAAAGSSSRQEVTEEVLLKQYHEQLEAVTHLKRVQKRFSSVSSPLEHAEKAAGELKATMMSRNVEYAKIEKIEGKVEEKQLHACRYLEIKFRVRDSHVERVIPLVLEGLGFEWDDDKYRFRVVPEAEGTQATKKDTSQWTNVVLHFGESCTGTNSVEDLKKALEGKMEGVDGKIHSRHNFGENLEFKTCTLVDCRCCPTMVLAIPSHKRAHSLKACIEYLGKWVAIRRYTDMWSFQKQAVYVCANAYNEGSTAEDEHAWIRYTKSDNKNDDEGKWEIMHGRGECTGVIHNGFLESVFPKQNKVERIRDGDVVIIDSVRFCFRRPELPEVENVRESPGRSPQYDYHEREVQDGVNVTSTDIEAGEDYDESGQNDSYDDDASFPEDFRQFLAWLVQLQYLRRELVEQIISAFDDEFKKPKKINTHLPHIHNQLKLARDEHYVRKVGLLAIMRNIIDATGGDAQLVKEKVSTLDFKTRGKRVCCPKGHALVPELVMAFACAGCRTWLEEPCASYDCERCTQQQPLCGGCHQSVHGCARPACRFGPTCDNCKNPFYGGSKRYACGECQQRLCGDCHLEAENTFERVQNKMSLSWHRELLSGLPKAVRSAAQKILDSKDGEELKVATTDLKWFAAIVQLRRRANLDSAHAWVLAADEINEEKNTRRYVAQGDEAKKNVKALGKKETSRKVMEKMEKSCTAGKKKLLSWLLPYVMLQKDVRSGTEAEKKLEAEVQKKVQRGNKARQENQQKAEPKEPQALVAQPQARGDKRARDEENIQPQEKAPAPVPAAAPAPRRRNDERAAPPASSNSTSSSNNISIGRDATGVNANPSIQQKSRKESEDDAPRRAAERAAARRAADHGGRRDEYREPQHGSAGYGGGGHGAGGYGGAGYNGGSGSGGYGPGGYGRGYDGGGAYDANEGGAGYGGAGYGDGGYGGYGGAYDANHGYDGQYPPRGGYGRYPQGPPQRGGHGGHGRGRGVGFRGARGGRGGSVSGGNRGGRGGRGGYVSGGYQSDASASSSRDRGNM